MLPVLTFGPWRLPTYLLCVAVAVLVAGMYGFHRLLRLGPAAVVVRGFGLIVLAAAASPFLAYLLFYLLHRWWPGSPPPGTGISVTWALAGGAVAALLYFQRMRLPLAHALDLGLLPVPLGLAIVRLGCFAAGCCAGRPTTSWLGLYLPGAGHAWAMRYPTQLWSAAANLLIFVTLVAVERHPPAEAAGRPRSGRLDGRLALLFVGLYSVKRFVIAFARESAVPLVGPLSAMHLYALAGLLAVALLAIRGLTQTARSV